MESKFRNEDIGMSVIRRINKLYQVLSADMDKMKVIFWVPFDHDDEAKIALLNKFINDINNSKNNPHAKKRPYEFEFGFGNPDLGGEIHSLQGLQDDDSFVLSAWYNDTDAIYSQEEYTDCSEDIYYIIASYLHRLKCDKGAHYGESVSNKDKMNLSEAKEILKDAGYIIEDTDTLQDEWDRLDKNHAFPNKHEFDVHRRIHKSSLDNKIKGAKTFNMMNNIKSYEKQLIAKLKEAGLKITSSNPDSTDKRLTQYDIEINYKGETEEGFVGLYVDDGELWVNYELFSGISGNDPYEEFIDETLPMEINDFKENVDKYEEE